MFFYIFVESLGLIMLVYFLFFIVFYKYYVDNEMMSSYECGFDPKSGTRLVFSYSFFLISILFIIFDVEISLMISIPFFMMKELGLLVFLIFILILMLGLMYEYYYGSLDWLIYYKG